MPDDKPDKQLWNKSTIEIEPIEPMVGAPTVTQPHDTLIPPPPPNPNGARPQLGEHSMSPRYLFAHPNDYDQNVVTPDWLRSQDIHRHALDPIKKA
jgi:hypothetical protein